MVNLIELRLEDNRIVELPKDMEILTNLNRLYLDNNQISRIPIEFTKLINLKSRVVLLVNNYVFANTG